MQSSQIQTILTCQICHIHFNTWSLLQKHKKKYDHQEPKPYKCELCENSYNYQTNLNLHKAMHQTSDFYCPLCKKQFKRLASVKSHIMIHQIEENLGCMKCGEEFNLQSELNYHNMTKHLTEFSTNKDEKEKIFIKASKINNNLSHVMTSKIRKLYEEVGESNDSLRQQIALITKENNCKSDVSFVGNHYFQGFSNSTDSVAINESGFLDNYEFANAYINHSNNICSNISHVQENDQSVQEADDILIDDTNMNVSILDVDSSDFQALMTSIEESSEQVTLNNNMLKPNRNHKQLNLNLHASENNVSNYHTKSSMNLTNHYPIHNGFKLKLKQRLDKSNRLKTKRICSLTCGICQRKFLKARHLERHMKIHINIRGKKYSNDVIEPENLLDLAATTPRLTIENVLDAIIETVQMSSPGNQWLIYQNISSTKDWNYDVQQLKATRKLETSDEPTKQALIKRTSCAHCLKSFLKPCDLARHVRVHTKERPYACSICGRSFSVKSSLVTHTKSQHLKDYTTNPITANHQVRRYPLTAHIPDEYSDKSTIKIIGGSSKPMCNFCNKEFSSIASLRLHFRLHTGQKPFSCEVCGNKFRTSGNLRGHMISAHKDYDFSTPPLFAVAAGATGLEAPSKTAKLLGHGVGKLFNNNTYSPALLEVDPGPSKCLLNNDIPITISNAFQAPQNLPQGAISRESPNNETSIERPFKCSYCEKGYKKSSHLKDHVRGHTGERPYKCPICSKTFATSSILTNHASTHALSANRRTFTCTSCFARFCTKGSLKRHVKTLHSNADGVFQCYLCKRSYRTYENYHKHVQVYHEIAMQEDFVRKGNSSHEPFPVPDSHNIKTSDPNLSSDKPNHRVYEWVQKHYIEKGDISPGEIFYDNESISNNFEKIVADDQETIILDEPFLNMSQSQTSYLMGAPCRDTHPGNGQINLPFFHIPDNNVAVVTATTTCDTAKSPFHFKGCTIVPSTTLPYQPNQLFPAPDSVNFNLLRYSNDTSTTHNNNFHTTCQQPPAIASSQLQSQPRHILPVTAAEQRPVPQYQFLIVDADNNLFVPIALDDGQVNHQAQDQAQMINGGGHLSSLLPFNVGNTEISGYSYDTCLATSSTACIKPQPLPLPHLEGRHHYPVLPLYVKNDDGGTFTLGKSFAPSPPSFESMAITNSDPTPITSIQVQQQEQRGGLLRRQRVMKTVVSLASQICVNNNDNYSINSTTTTITVPPLIFNAPPLPPLNTTATTMNHLDLPSSKIKAPPADDAFKLALQNFRPISVQESSFGSGQKFLTEPLLCALNHASIQPSSVAMADETAVTPKPKHRVAKCMYHHVCEYCSKPFKKPSDLSRHVRTHTGEKPYVCEICSKCFTVKSSLTSHLQTHSGEKSFKCDICNTFLSSRASLNVHMRLHTGQRPYKCDFCNSTFRTYGHRKSHILAIHLKSKNDQLLNLSYVTTALETVPSSNSSQGVDFANLNLGTNILTPAQISQIPSLNVRLSQPLDIPPLLNFQYTTTADTKTNPDILLNLIKNYNLIGI